MSGAGLKPDERVVELAAVCVAAAVVAGAAAGAALGYGLGQLVARHFYRTDDGLTSVVRVGKGSLPATLRAGLMGGVLAALAIGVLAFLVPGAMAQALPILGAALACGVVLGAALASLSSLL